MSECFIATSFAIDDGRVKSVGTLNLLSLDTHFPYLDDNYYRVINLFKQEAHM